MTEPLDHARWCDLYGVRMDYCRCTELVASPPPPTNPRWRKCVGCGRGFSRMEDADAPDVSTCGVCTAPVRDAWAQRLLDLPVLVLE